MSKQRSEACPYSSRFSGVEPIWLTAAQYLAEFMVARQARIKSVDLPQKFWSRDPWKRDFMLQLRLATSLLKLYPPEAVSAVLRSTEGKRAFSLGAKWLDPLFQAATTRLERERLARESEPPPTVPAAEAINEKPREGFVARPSLLSRLRELD